MDSNNNPKDSQAPPQNNSNNPTSPSMAPADPANPTSPSFAARVAAVQARTNVSESSAVAAVSASQAAAASMYNHPPTVAMAMSMQNPAPVPPPTLPPLSVLRKQKYKKRTKKYNNFNIFFMLERQLLLHSRGGGGIDAIKNPVDITDPDSPLAKHKDLKLPGLCRRYNHLPLTANWFLELLANQNKKRPHRKSHGLIPFKELAQTIAKNYKEIDDETQEFVNEVAERLAWHYEELEKEEEKERKEYEKKYGIPPPEAGGYAGKKRKEAPIVSKGTGPEYDPNAWGMGMGGMNRNTPPYGMPHGYGGMPGYPPSSYPGMGGHPNMYPPHMNMPSGNHNQNNNTNAGPNSSSQQYPNTRPRSSSPSGGGSGGGAAAPNDVEGQRLQLELARAMSERDESLHRIGLLKTQMSIHQAKQRADFARFENELLMEALIRRMTPAPGGAEGGSGGGGAASSSASSRPGGSAMNAPPSPSVLASYLNQRGAPLDKRQKFDENDFKAKSEGNKEGGSPNKKDGSPEAVRGGSAEGWIVQ